MRWLLLILLLSVVTCAPPEQIPPEFDGELAMTYLIQQTSLGPRVPGSAAWQKCQQYLIRRFVDFGLAVDSQRFSFYDPYSKSEMELLNLNGQYRGGDIDDIPLLLVAHYDSRPRTDYHSDSSRINEPIVGANDGASGVAVLLELARMVSQDQPKVNVDFLMVDGEDWGKPGDTEYYLLGSKYFATNEGNIRGRYRFAIVLDMVGAKNQRFYREGYSEQFNKDVNDMVWSVAHKLGVTSFVDSVKHGILDGHMSINVGGVPAIDIINLNYPFWHTEHDTPDKCSAESLENVGKVVAYVLYNRSVWPN